MPPVVRDAPGWIMTGNQVSSTPLPQYDFPQTISKPFIGVDGSSRAAMEAGWPTVLANAIDFRKVLEQSLRLLHPVTDAIRLEDITKIELATLISSDGLIGTAPCQDFSSMYTGLGLAGARGSLFMIQLGHVKHLSRRREKPLKWIMLETVKGVLAVRRGHDKSPYDLIQEWWETEMRHWTPLELWLPNQLHCSQPVSRPRVVMVAFSRSFATAVGGLPAHPPKHPRVKLESELEVCLDSDFDRLSRRQQKNIADWKPIFDAQCQQRGLPNALGVIDSSRSPYARFKASVAIDSCHMFSTKNSRMAILRHGASAKVPPQGRLLKTSERCKLHGVLADTLLGQSCSQRVFSIGNMFPVDMAGVCLRQIMMKWVIWERRLMRVSYPLPAPSSDNYDNANAARPKRRRVQDVPAAD